MSARPPPPDPGLRYSHKPSRPWLWKAPLTLAVILALVDLWAWALLGFDGRPCLALGLTAFGLAFAAFFIGLAQAEGI